MKSSTHKFLYTAIAMATRFNVREGEGGAGGEGGAAGGTPPIDTDKLIADAVALAVTGLKAKNDELLGKVKDGQTRLAAFGTLDPARAKQIMETMDNDEDVKLFSEGKKNQVIDKYTERMRTDHITQMDSERAKTVAESQRADAYRGAVLDNQIRAVTGECHKGAVEDALLLARQIFTLDAKGNAVKLDSEGRPELGKDGKTPFSPAEWMELQRELKSHWFLATTSGSGSSGAQGSGSGTGKSIKRSDFNNLSPAQQGVIARAGTTSVD